MLSKWIRKIKGAIGMGLTWGFAWLGAGLVLLLIVGPDAADVPFPLGFGALGFLAGLTFSGVLGVVEGRRRFDQMSMPRFALWGGIGGFLFALGFTALVGIDLIAVLGPVFSLAGAACAAGSLALARVAEDQDLIDAGTEAGEVGLSEREKRELLGGG